MHSRVALNLKLFYFSFFSWEYLKNFDSLPPQLTFEMSGEMQYMQKNVCDIAYICTVPTNLLAWLQKVIHRFGASGWLIAFF